MCFRCASLTEPKEQGKFLFFCSKLSLSVFKIGVEKKIQNAYFLGGFTVLNKNDPLCLLEGQFLKMNQICYILNLKCFSMESLATSCGPAEK